MNKRTFPEFRIVANEDTLPAKLVTQTIEKKFTDHTNSLKEKDFAFLTAHELPKSPEQISLLIAADETVNEFLDSLNLPTFTFKPKSAHLLKEEDMVTFQGSSEIGKVIPAEGMMLLNQDGLRACHPLVGAKIILHEIIHGKGFLSEKLTVNTEKRSFVSKLRRTGLGSTSADGVLFVGFNEGFVETLTMHLAQRFLQRTHLAKIHETQNTPRTNALKIEFARRNRILPEDISVLYQTGPTSYKWEAYMYFHERQVIRQVMEAIVTDNPITFPHISDVFAVIARSHFSGPLIELGRLIEQSFGKGAFRRIAEMNRTNESAKACFTELQERRADLLHQK